MADTSIPAQGTTPPTAPILPDGTIPFTGNQSMGGNKITSLGAGTSLTDAVNRSQIPIVLPKAVQTSRTNTSSVADDPELVFNLEANSKYRVEMDLFVDIAPVGVTTPGFKFTIVSDIGTTWFFGEIRTLAAGVGTELAAGQCDGGIELGASAGGSDGARLYVRARGNVTFGQDAGNLKLRWAQNSAQNKATSILIGSNLTVQKVS